MGSVTVQILTRLFRVRLPARAILTVLLVAPTGLGAQEEQAWFWFATCGGPTMAVEVQFDRRTIQKVTTPVCRAPRSGAGRQGQASTIEFAFRPARMVRWVGYKDSPQRTRGGERLELTLWQAGADADSLTIGVSILAADAILMNTVHIAHPRRRDESILARGLTLATYPVNP